MRQESILLTFIKAMDFVHKQDRPPSGVAILPRTLNRLADLFDPRGHRRDPLDIGTGVAGNHFSQRRFSGAWRPPEDHRVQLARFNRPWQRLTRCQQVLLTDILR